MSNVISNTFPLSRPLIYQKPLYFLLTIMSIKEGTQYSLFLVLHIIDLIKKILQTIHWLQISYPMSGANMLLPLAPPSQHPPGGWWSSDPTSSLAGIAPLAPMHPFLLFSCRAHPLRDTDFLELGTTRELLFRQLPDLTSSPSITGHSKGDLQAPAPFHR